MTIPVGGPQNPFDKELRVERVDEDKLAKEDKRKRGEERLPPDKLGVAAYLLQMFRKAIDFFAESEENAKSIEQQTKNNLLFLKEVFNTLKTEDRSQDTPFLNRLSKIWQDLLENAIHFKKDETAQKLKEFIRSIQHYPPNQAHTFGYYLIEHAGQKWIPFPYMELVQKIHHEHEKNPTGSALTSWTAQIEEILLLLQLE